YAMLSRIYLRSGQYLRLLNNLDEWAAVFPDRPEFREAKNDVERFRRLPDQSNGARHRSVLRHDDDSFTLPVSINGKTADYLFDTGAWLSVISEPEAKRLGLPVSEERGELTGSSGMHVKFR